MKHFLYLVWVNDYCMTSLERDSFFKWCKSVGGSYFFPDSYFLDYVFVSLPSHLLYFPVCQDYVVKIKSKRHFLDLVG